MNPYIESFLPLFVAINVLGLLPMYLALTEEMSAAERRRLTLQAVATASLIAVLILFAGQLIFSVLCNNWTVSVREVERVQDAIAVRLAELVREGGD